jgi:NitT/TauT family transport system substrate-binding protein
MLGRTPLRLIALLLFFSVSACDEGLTGPERANVTIAVAGQSNLIFLPLTLAQERGYFAAEGLTVTILNVASGADARNAVVNGTADVAMGFYEHVFTLRASQNVDGVAFVLFGDAPGVAVGVRPALASTVKSIKDLSGRKIGISSNGSGSHNTIRYLLRKENIAESAVTFVPVGLNEAAEAALELGQIDALSNIDPAITDLQLRNGITLLSDTRTRAGTQAVYGGDYAGTSFYAKRSFLEQYPGTAQALANASVKTLAWMAASTPEQILAPLSDSFLGGQRSLYVQMLKNSTGMFVNDGHFDESALTRVLQAFSLFDAAVAGANISVGATYTNEFVNRAN